MDFKKQWTLNPALVVDQMLTLILVVGHNPTIGGVPNVNFVALVVNSLTLVFCVYRDGHNSSNKLFLASLLKWKNKCHQDVLWFFLLASLHLEKKFPSLKSRCLMSWGIRNVGNYDQLWHHTFSSKSHISHCNVY